MHERSSFLSALNIFHCCFFHCCHPIMCEVVSHCDFHLHFPNDWWHWSSFHIFVGHLYILWRNVCSSPLPILKLGCFLCCWVLSIIYIFWILDPYQIYDLQIFLPVLAFVFSHFDSPTMHEVLILMRSNTSIFLLWFMLLVSCLRNFCQIKGRVFL